jgi:hypothetical protein
MTIIKKTYLTLILISILMFCIGCSHEAQIYAQNKPKADIRKYFNGKLEAFGILQDRSGKVIKTFTVALEGSWKGNVGTLKEHFNFSDGKKDDRIWTLKMIDDHNFTGTAHDIVGTSHGQQYGNAIKMNYIITIPVDGKKYDIKVKDWLFLVDDKSLINVSDMTKFGIRVGRLAIGFKKLN